MEMMALLHRNEVIQYGYVGAVVDGFGIAICDCLGAWSTLGLGVWMDGEGWNVE